MIDAHAGDLVRVKVLVPGGYFPLRDLHHGELVCLVRFEDGYWRAKKGNGRDTIVFDTDIDCIVEKAGHGSSFPGENVRRTPRRLRYASLSATSSIGDTRYPGARRWSLVAAALNGAMRIACTLTAAGCVRQSSPCCRL